MYSIKKVSQILGIPAVTIRAWENRHSIIHPVRSEGGHRLYSEDDIKILKWIKQQIDEKGMKVSEAVSFLKQKEMEVNREDIEYRFQKEGFEDLIERLYVNLVRLNTIEAHKSIDLAFSMYSYMDVFHHVLAPILYRIGDDWEKGNITVAQEHFSSQLIMQRCSQFLWSLPIQPLLPKVLSLCPEGELHHMGLMLFSLFLRNKGLDVTYLGPNTPLKDLIGFIRMKKISLVAISITDPLYKEPLRNWIETCRQENKTIQFVLGGSGFLHDTTPLSSYILSGDQADWEKWYQTIV